MKNLNVGFLITGRLKSTRLKRKILLKIKGKTILSHMIDRIKQSKKVSKIIICTSKNKQDRELKNEAIKNKIDIFFGHEEDVIKRLYDAAIENNLDYILNITADCPFVDPSYADKIVEEYKKNDFDLIRQFDLPHGVFCYGIKITALKKIIEIKSSNRTEVWGNYFTNTGLFKIKDLPVKNKFHIRPDLRMTLDYIEDYNFIKLIFNALYIKNKIFSLDQIIEFLDKNPEVININKSKASSFMANYLSQNQISLKKSNTVSCALVVGCGSIGQRHIKNLQALGIKNIIALRTKKGHFKKLPKNLNVVEHSSWKKVLSLKPDIAIISNPSSLHIDAINKVKKSVKGIFIEKPLSNKSSGCKELLNELRENMIVNFVGNNLFFHPIFVNIFDFINSNNLGRLINIQIQAGQFLPDWHPYEDYKKAYYSRKELGGGVTLTLIHEIQSAIKFCGKPSVVSAFINNDDSLKIPVESSSDILIEHENKAVSHIHLDYLQKLAHRSGNLTFENGWISYDFQNNECYSQTILGKKKLIWSNKKYDNNSMYLEELKEFIKLTEEKHIKHEYDLGASIESLKVVETAIKSSLSKKALKMDRKEKKIIF